MDRETARALAGRIMGEVDECFDHLLYNDENEPQFNAALTEIAAILSTIDRPAPVVEVKGLEWDGQTLECEVCAAEPYLGPRYAVLPSPDPDGGFLVRTGTGAGYFDGSRRHETKEAAKSACEAQWQTSVRQLLTATTRDEVIEGLAVEAAAEATCPLHSEWGRDKWRQAAKWLRSHKVSAS